jgi:hypothetical protein
MSDRFLVHTCMVDRQLPHDNDDDWHAALVVDYEAPAASVKGNKKNWAMGMMNDEQKVYSMGVKAD